MRLLASGGVLLAGFLAGGVASSSAPLAAQQLRYSLRPTVTWTEWDETLGLENARFLGGSAGLGFGEYVDVTAFYVKSDDRSTHLSSLPFAADMGSPLPDQYLDVASYGTELSLVPAHLNRAGDRRYRRSSSGAALTLEPFGGQQAFDPGFGIEDQDIAGFRADFDLGPFVGLRGFYWRGTDGHHAWEEGIRGYGGEAQLSLGGLAVFSPHLLAGAGRMEFGPDLARDAEGIPADRTTQARRCILNFVRRPARAFPFLRRLLPGGRAIRRSRLADSVPGAADARGSRVQRQRRPLPVTGDRGAWAVPS